MDQVEEKTREPDINERKPHLRNDRTRYKLNTGGVLAGNLRKAFDPATKAILHDWCVQQGIHGVAEQLRAKSPTLQLYQQVCTFAQQMGCRPLHRATKSWVDWAGEHLDKEAFKKLSINTMYGKFAPGPSQVRQYPLGFPSTDLSPRSTTTVSVQPQVPFRGRRLVIPSNIADAIMVEGIYVGRNNMLMGPVPARAFTELAMGMELTMETAQVSQQVSLRVVNTSDRPLRFDAAIIGVGVEELAADHVAPLPPTLENVCGGTRLDSNGQLCRGCRACG